ncbi:hypothetical protein [Streptomyces lincolnensis]|uniref:hypothetical protein n=1 Tax=Streptomyces lincolnensis TaxID=1915 RepID=UPI0037CD5C29
MSELTTEQQLEQTRTELARLRAGLAAGLTPEQSARLQGATDEELTADAEAFAAELGLSAPPTPASRSGGPRGVDVGTSGGVEGGAERFRQKHPQREVTPAEQQRRTNPYQERTYTMTGR